MAGLIRMSSPLGKTIWVTVKREGPVVHLKVRDEGPGLTEDDKQKLFGKFQRLSALPTNNESSTGLGLSIVKQIVEMHGGRVWAESETGQGSTFILELASETRGEPADSDPSKSRESRDRIASVRDPRQRTAPPADS